MGQRMGMCLIAAGALALGTVDGLHGQQGYLGVKAGYASMGISSDPAPNGERLGETKNRSGFTGGVVGGIRFSPVFSIRAEAAYSQKGFRIEDEAQEGAFEIDVIEIPILANLHLGDPNASIAPRVYGGPWISFEARCSLVVATAEAGCDDVPGQAVRKTTDYGVALGAALDVANLGGVIVSADGRYTLGFQNIDDTPEIENLNVKTRGFTVTLGIGIPLGG